MYYINPRVDFAFKKLFGSEENNDLLISLINIEVAKKMLALGLSEEVVLQATGLSGTELR